MVATVVDGVVVAEGEQGGEVVGVVAQTFSPCLDGFLREVQSMYPWARALRNWAEVGRPWSIVRA